MGTPLEWQSAEEPLFFNMPDMNHLCWRVEETMAVVGVALISTFAGAL